MKQPKPPKKFNGKPMSHWQEMADDLVMHHLVRAIHNCDENSMPGRLAKQRLLEIAQSENPALLASTQEERDRCLANLPAIIASLIG